MSNEALDAVSTAIVERRLRMAAREMGTVLLRTARSPVFHQAQDFATAIFDRRGELLQHGDYIPLLAVALGPGLRQVLAVTEEVVPGDAFLHNDVFSGGNQLSDVAVYVPVFVENALVGWVGCKGHQADIGGGVRGGVNPDAQEVWQEGLRIPVIKLVDRGVLSTDLWNMLLANARLPDVVGADLRAQLGACAVGARAVRELVARYGIDDYRRHTQALLDGSERMMRRFIESIPDGVRHAKVTKRLIGDHGQATISLTITVQGDDLCIDCTGSDPQTRTYINAPVATTEAAITLLLRLLGGGELLLNEGMLRPIRIEIAAGSILGASYPAATAYGNHLTDQIATALFGALAPLVPDRVPAGWNALYGSYVNCVDSDGKEHHDVLFLANKGGSGAVCGADGYDHIGSIEGCGTIRSADYEMFELHNPITLLEHEYDQDSGGAGRWRGGLGVVTRMRFEAPNTELVLFGDGLDEGAPGVFGGLPGSRNSAELLYPDGSRRLAAANDVISSIPAGTLLEKRAGGGGGWGEPELRDRDAVQRDVLEGFVSAADAERFYGLVDLEVTV
jgi:N-methylhydantoinase B